MDTSLQVISTSPINNSKDIFFSPHISVEFDRRVGISSDANLILSIDGQEEESISFNKLDTRLSLVYNSLSIELTNTLSPATAYTFTLPKGALTDATGTPNDEYSFTFTTANAGASIDSSFFTLSTNTWYEIQNTDDGSFNQTIDITFLSDEVDTNSSLSDTFDTPLVNRIGDTTTPITIDGLPDGLSLTLSQTSTGIQLGLTGKATSHSRSTISLDMTLLSDFFQVSDLYTSADISFSFDIVFGSEWKPRNGHQAFVYDDKMWILGGQGVQDETSTNKNDIWTSADGGVTWTPVSITGTHWSGRRGHQSFVYNDKIWILGGYDGTYKNDIWTSADGGIIWTPVSVTGAHWSGRRGHQSFVYNDKIWVLGGEDDSNSKNDIWTSTDEGITWTPVSVTGAHWSGRYSHQSFVYNDKIWVLGGIDPFTRDDIWVSADSSGTTWTNVSPSETYWAKRGHHQSFVHDDKIWILGGGGLPLIGSAVDRNDIWTSGNGTNWTPVSVTGGHWSGRSHHQSFVYNDKIWVLGGNRAANPKNDIWTSADDGVTWQQVISQFY